MKAPLPFFLLIVLTVTAPGEPPQIVSGGPGYRLEWTESRGALRLLPQTGEPIPVPLPLEENRWGRPDIAHDSKELPLPFVSPDGQWIFVPTRVRTNVMMKFQRDEAPAQLLHRASGELRPALPTRFDKAAHDFLSREFTPKELKPGHPPEDLVPSYDAGFVAWSDDSVRLLMFVESGIYSHAKDQWVESAHSFYCYFNTKTGAFEQTDRLRDANRRIDQAWTDRFSNKPKDEVVLLDAEAAGREGPETPAGDRFATADRQLNEAYKKLMAATPAPAREVLRAEERVWLLERDTSARVYAIQSWSGGEARFVQGQAVATEARVAELVRRLSEGSH